MTSNHWFGTTTGRTVNPGNLIELLLLVMFVGGGAVVGNMIGGYPGTVIGGVGGVGVRL